MIKRDEHKQFCGSFGNLLPCYLRTEENLFHWQKAKDIDVYMLFHKLPALGVSGGPDSMALCVLAADWKTTGPDSAAKTDGFISGLSAIIVDHGLRIESGEEAKTVLQQVSNMGMFYQFYVII